MSLKIKETTMKIKYLATVLLSFCFLTYASADENNVDCIILEDENSIICKYMLTRVDSEKTIQVQWIEPDNTISRERDMIIPQFHGSIYDYRYINGRTKGTWTFKVIDDEKEYTTHFTIE